MWAFLLMVAAWFVYTAMQQSPGHPRIASSASGAVARARRLLREDSDGFVAGFTSADLVARGALTCEDYCARAANAIRDLGSDERMAVNTALNSLPATLREVAHDVVLVTDGGYEGGMPHTRGRFVFLPERLVDGDQALGLRSTLGHELVHVEQRASPARARAWAEAHGYALAPAAPLTALVRANPDLDGRAWTFRGQPVGFVYASDQPRDLRDGSVVGSSGYEHPHEHQAYEFLARA